MQIYILFLFINHLYALGITLPINFMSKGCRKKKKKTLASAGKTFTLANPKKVPLFLVGSTLSTFFQHTLVYQMSAPKTPL